LTKLSKSAEFAISNYLPKKAKEGNVWYWDFIEDKNICRSEYPDDKDSYTDPV